MSHRRFMATIAVTLALLYFAVLSGSAQSTTRLSVGAGSTQSNADCYRPRISADGRFAVYASDASNLVTGDNNGLTDIFITEIATQTTRRVNVSTGGAEATGGTSSFPAVSGDGRYVAFESLATNLVTGDANAKYDIFVRDTLLNRTERVSVGMSGTESDANSRYPALSRDGRYVTFESFATNLVAGDNNNRGDVFLYDRLLRKTTLVSVSSAGVQGNNDSGTSAISPEGRFVAFNSDASNLVAGDTNNFGDVFLRDTVNGTTIRISVSSAGAEGDDASGFNDIFVSANGQFVIFDSYAASLVAGDTNGVLDVFVRDVAANTTTRVSVSSAGAQADTDAYADGISDDGRYVLFDSFAATLVLDDTNGFSDCFLRDRQTNTTLRVSVSSSSGQSDADSAYCDLTPDANNVVFVSNADNLVTGDTNGSSDIFVRSPLQTTAEVRGTLTLQGITPTAPDQLITFIFHRAAGDLVRTASVSPSGAFVVNGVPRDTYTLLIKGGSYLATKTTVNATAGNVTLPNLVLLRTGDANGDNFADIRDLLPLINAYNTAVGDTGYSVTVDFNLDGSDDISDLLLLITNYNQQGDFLP